MWNASWLYVGALYAAAVWLARRAGVDLPRHIAFLFYLLALGFLLRPLTTQTVSFPTDIQELVPPWSVGSQLTKFTVSNPQLPDVTMQMVPWAHQVREAWRSGELPLWNPFAGAGMPLAANGQSSAFSPFRILALPLPLGYAMTAEGAMKILVALTFTFLFCRRRGFSNAASAIAAISYGFSLFVVVWLHFTQATVAVFLPAAFYAVDLLVERVTPPRIMAAAILWACSLIGGHTETSARVALFAALYGLWRMNKPFIVGALAAASAALAMASPLIVAMAEAIPLGRRYHELRQMPYGDVPFSDLPSLLLMLQPRLFGGLPSDVAHAEAISGFAGILGIAGLIGAIIAFRPSRWRDDATFFGAGWLIAFLAVANVPPVRTLFYWLIPYTAHARFRVILCFFSAVLVAMLIDRLRYAAVAGAAILLLFTFIYLREVPLSSIPAIAVLAIAAMVPFNRRLGIPILGAAVIVELWAAGRGWNPVKPVETMYPKTPMITAVQQLSAGKRLVGTGGTLYPNTNAVFGLEDVRVLDAIASHRYMTTVGFDYGEFYPKWPDLASPLLDDLNVGWIATEPGADLSHIPRYALVYDGPDGRIYENRGVKPRFFSDRASVRVERLGAADFKLEVNAAQPAMIASGQAFWPGWKVVSDGRTLPPRIVNGAFLGFEAPAGRSVIRVRYAPLKIYVCVALAALTFIALMVWAGRRG